MSIIERRPSAAAQVPLSDTDRHDGINFRAPRDLEVSLTQINRVVLVGQCILNAWSFQLERQHPGLSIEHILFNFTAELPDNPPAPAGEYDFQIVAVPLRGILHESKFLRLSYLDSRSVERLFDEACDQMSLFLRMAMKWNTAHSILSFVANFLVPQQNPNGRLMPRYDLRNLAYFVERLNECLAQEVATYTNAYCLDLDQISASVGRRYIQDDSVCTIAHGSTLANFAGDVDQRRIEPPKLPLMTAYNAKIGIFIDEVWRELQAMYRTLRQTDIVKMVIMDLDDTLWRGVLAELDSISLEAIEGWPLGVIEALAFLKKRGVILAIVSKNEEVNVKRIFEQLLRHRLPLDSFALRRINWLPKVQNIQEIIQEANLLPKNVVFVDDNPVERAAVAAAFPDLRIIGADPYVVRRILLWAPETQVVGVTNESARRGEMIQAQVHREVARKSLSREDFLNTLNVEIRFLAITKTNDPNFPRAFELLNKTNQFNTTGKRWTMAEISGELQNGLELVCFFVEDKFTEYGLVGVVLVRDGSIPQYVMSCRVLGLDVEKAVLAHVIGSMERKGAAVVEASLKETDANFPCRALYRDNGFVQDNEIWWFDLARQALATPSHIRVQNYDSLPSVAPPKMRVTEQSLGEVDSPGTVSALPDHSTKFPDLRLERGIRYAFTSVEERPWLGDTSGLGRKEKGGTWTIAERATLPFRIATGPSDETVIDIELYPYLVPQSPSRGLTILVNGALNSRWRFEGDHSELSKIRVRISSTLLGAHGEVVLTLEIDQPCSPEQLGVSEDPRRLGVSLVSLSLALR